MNAGLPEVLEDHWTTTGGHEMATTYAAMTRADLGNRHLTDLELANAIFMADRQDLRLIGLQIAAKERIRWLSAHLAQATCWSRETSAAPEAFDEVYFLVRPRGTHPGRGQPYVPSVVTRLGNQLFRGDNHIDALVWSKNGDMRQGPTTNMHEAELEWRPLP